MASAASRFFWLRSGRCGGGDGARDPRGREAARAGAGRRPAHRLRPHRPAPARAAAPRGAEDPPGTDDQRHPRARRGGRRCLEAAWRDGFAYIKAGVLLDDLCPPEAAPPDLLDGPRAGSAALMAAVDRINARFGRGGTPLGKGQRPDPAALSWHKSIVIGNEADDEEPACLRPIRRHRLFGRGDANC